MCKNRDFVCIKKRIMNVTLCFYVLQCSWAPCEKYNLADASSCQLLSQTKCKWLTRPLILLQCVNVSLHKIYCLVVEASLQLVFEFLRSPPSFSSHRAVCCFIAFFSFNKNSFPLADQQLMYHLDTTSATRPPFNREAWSPENTLSLSLSLTVSLTPTLYILFTSRWFNSPASVPAVHPPRRQAGEYPHHQTPSHQTLWLWVRQDSQWVFNKQLLYMWHRHLLDSAVPACYIEGCRCGEWV